MTQHHVGPPERPAVREIRLSRGLTQRQLAERAGVSAPTVIHIEKGRHGPGLVVARKIADALDATIDEVFPRPPTHATLDTQD